jgi:hypothetical protein
MSSDETNDQPLIRVRQRRRAMDTSDTPPKVEPADVFNPGPMVNYAPVPTGPDGLPIPTAIRHRVRELRAIDRNAAREFILRTLHAFLLAHRPIDEIARAFGVSTRMIYSWRSELYKRMAQELRSKMPTDLLSQQIMHYERAKAYAWQNASKTPDHTEKRGWVLAAMKAEEKITDLYERAGLLKETLKPVTPVEDEDVHGGATALAAIARSFLVGGYQHAKAKAEPPQTIETETGPLDEGDFLL